MDNASNNFILGELNKFINDEKIVQYDLAVQIGNEEIKIPMKSVLPEFSEQKNNQVRSNLESLRDKIIIAEDKFDFRAFENPALIAFVLVCAITLLAKYWGWTFSLKLLFGIFGVLFVLLVIF